MKESTFKGSNLEVTINNTKNEAHLYNLIDSAFKKQPESKFWEAAFELISKKYNHEKTNILSSSQKQEA